MTRPHPIAWLRAHPRAADVILAVFMTAPAVMAHVLALDQSEEYRDPSWWTVLLVIASVFPIACPPLLQPEIKAFDMPLTKR